MREDDASLSSWWTDPEATPGGAWFTPNRDWGYQSQGMDQPFVEATSWTEADVPGQREVTQASAIFQQLRMSVLAFHH